MSDPPHDRPSRSGGHDRKGDRPTGADFVGTEPAALLETLGVDRPRHIDIEAIAHETGATVVYEPLRGCEARLLACGDRAIITVDRAARRDRQRFSAAHELGHWMLHRGRSAFACTDDMLHGGWNHDSPEVDANRWAAELLMPSEMFARDAYPLGVSWGTARELARRYRTSLLATALRLVQVSDEVSSMILWNRPGRRWRWFHRSPWMPAGVWPHDSPGPGTVAYRLLRGERVAPGPKMVKWAEWIRLETPLLYYVYEDSIRLRNGDVLTLLEWTDETPLLDFHGYQPSLRRGWVGERG